MRTRGAYLKPKMPLTESGEVRFPGKEPVTCPEAGKAALTDGFPALGSGHYLGDKRLVLQNH